MTDHNDQDLMAVLFLSIGGELGCFPERTDERFFYIGTTRWDRLSVPYFLPEAIAAGILGLIRERDEARYFAEQYGNLRPFPWENHRCPE